MSLTEKQYRILDYLAGVDGPATRKDMQAKCGRKGFSEALGSPKTAIRAESLEAKGFVRRLDAKRPFRYLITSSGRRVQRRVNANDSMPHGEAQGESQPGALVAAESDASGYPEGAQSYRIHRHLERDGSLVRRAKAERLRAVGCLACEVCGFNFSGAYGRLGSGFIEAHHKLPVASMNGSHKTSVSDLALVCSNCHRMLHRGDHLLSVEELREFLKVATKT